MKPNKPIGPRAVHKAEKALMKIGNKVSRLFDKIMDADAESDAFFALDEMEATLYRYGFIDRKEKRNAGR